MIAPSAEYYMGWVIQPLRPDLVCIYPRIDMSESKCIMVEGTIMDAYRAIDRILGR